MGLKGDIQTLEVTCRIGFVYDPNACIYSRLHRLYKSIQLTFTFNIHVGATVDSQRPEETQARLGAVVLQ